VSRESPFFNQIKSSYILFPQIADLSGFMEILDSGEVILWYESWGTVCECNYGRWALDDSILYIYHGESNFIGCHKEDEEKVSMFAEQPWIGILKVFNLTDSTIIVYGKRNKHITFKKGRHFNEELHNACK